MKLSLIVPFMAVDEDKYNILNRMLDSISGVDEILLIDNWMEGYAVPINLGLSQATGDFLVVSNDDLIWDGASLKRLCREGVVTSPAVDGKIQPFWGCAFCIPRSVYEKVGGLWEGYHISYYDDADYYQTLKKAGIPTYCVDSVNVQNPDGGRTLNRIPNRNQWFEENHQLYKERWGGEPEF